MHANLPEPVAPVFTLPEALRAVAANPGRSSINVADGEPPMPAPWRPRMSLRGATMFIHPGNLAVDMARLRGLPVYCEEDERD